MIERGMAFELVVRRFLGKRRAYGIAGQEANEKHRKEWLRKTGDRISREIDDIDTVEEHRTQLHHFSGEFRSALSSRKCDPWYLTYSLLGLVSALLGRLSASGSRYCLPSYTLTMDEYYTHLIRKGGDPLQHHYDKKNVVLMRKEVVSFLKEKGLSENQIALTMNTSAHQIRKLKK